MKFVSRRIVKWKISTSYLSFAVGRSNEQRRKIGVHNSRCHVLFLNVCGHDRSMLLFIFYAKYSVEKTWAAVSSLSLPFQFASLYTQLSGNCFILFIYSLLLTPCSTCKTCTNLNLFCGQIVWFRSFRGSRKKHHTYFLSVYSLDTFPLPLRPLSSLTSLPLAMNCTDIYDIFLMFRISFHYE